MELELDFPFEIVRTKRRKTLGIKITGTQVQVLAPQRVTNENIFALVKQKEGWIKAKLRLNAKFIPPKPKEYKSGENFSYLGKNYKLRLISDSPQKVQLKDEYLQLGLRQGLSDKQKLKYVSKQLLDWYRQNAEEHLLERTEHYAKILKVQPRSVSTREYKARWGSCSPDMEIKYNWRLIIASQRIIDYVIVHELCHIIELNHSPAFWSCVESVLPDYRKRRKWLKFNGMSLVI